MADEDFVMNAQLELEGDAFEKGIDDAVSSLTELETKGDTTTNSLETFQTVMSDTGEVITGTVDSFSALGSSFDDLTSLADSFSTSLGGLGEAAVTGGSDLAGFTDVTTEMGTNLTELEASVTAGSDSLSGFADVAIQTGTDLQTLEENASAGTDSISNLSTSVQTVGDDFSGLNDLITGTDDTMANLTKTTDSQVTSNDELTDSLSNTSTSAQKLEDDTSNLSDSLGNTDSAMENLARSSDTTTSSSNDLSDSLTNVGSSVETVYDNVSNLDDSMSNAGSSMGTFSDSADSAASSTGDLSGKLSDTGDEAQTTSDDMGGLYSQTAQNTLGVINFGAGLVSLSRSGVMWDRLALKLETSHNRLATATESLRKKDQALNAMIASGTHDVDAAVAAKQKLDEALAHLSELYNSGIRSGKDYEAAQQDVKKASDELKTAMVAEGLSADKVNNSVNGLEIGTNKLNTAQLKDKLTTEAVKRGQEDLMVTQGSAIIQTGSGLVQALDSARGAKAALKGMAEKLTEKLAAMGGGVISLTGILGGLAGKLTLVGSAFKTGILALGAPIAAGLAGVLAFAGAVEALSHNFMGITGFLSNVGAALGDMIPPLKGVIQAFGDAAASTADFFTKGIAEVTDWLGITKNAVGEADKSFSDLVTAYIKTGSTGRAQTDLQMKAWTELQASHGLSVDEMIAKSKELNKVYELLGTKMVEVDQNILNSLSLFGPKWEMAGTDVKQFTEALRGVSLASPSLEDVRTKFKYFTDDIEHQTPEIKGAIATVNKAFTEFEQRPTAENLKDIIDKWDLLSTMLGAARPKIEDINKTEKEGVKTKDEDAAATAKLTSENDLLANVFGTVTAAQKLSGTEHTALVEIATKHIAALKSEHDSLLEKAAALGINVSQLGIYIDTTGKSADQIALMNAVIEANNKAMEDQRNGVTAGTTATNELANENKLLADVFGTVTKAQQLTGVEHTKLVEIATAHVATLKNEHTALLEKATALGVNISQLGIYLDTTGKTADQIELMNAVIEANNKALEDQRNGVTNSSTATDKLTAENELLAAVFGTVTDAQKRSGTEHEKLVEVATKLTAQTTSEHDSLLLKAAALGINISQLGIYLDTTGKTNDQIALMNAVIEANIKALENQRNGVVATNEVKKEELTIEQLLAIEKAKHHVLSEQEYKDEFLLINARKAGLDTANKEVDSIRTNVEQQKAYREQLVAFAIDQGLATNAQDLSNESLLNLKKAYYDDTGAIEALSKTTDGLTGELGIQIDAFLEHALAVAQDTKYITDANAQHRIYRQGILQGITSAQEWTKSMMKQTQAEIGERGQLQRNAVTMGDYVNLLRFSTGKMKELIQMHQESKNGYAAEATAIAQNTAFVHNNALANDIRTHAILEGVIAANDWFTASMESVKAEQAEHDQLVKLAADYTGLPMQMSLTTDELHKVIAAQQATGDGAQALALINLEKLAPSYSALSSAINTTKMKEFHDAIKDLKIPKDLRDEAEKVLKPMQKLSELGGKAAVPFALLTVAGGDLSDKDLGHLTKELHKELTKISEVKGVGQPIDDMVASLNTMPPEQLRLHAGSVHMMFAAMKEGTLLDTAKQKEIGDLFTLENIQIGKSAAGATPQIAAFTQSLLDVGVPPDAINQIMQMSDSLGTDGLAGSAEDLIPKMQELGTQKLLNMGIPIEVVNSIMAMDTGTAGLGETVDGMPAKLTPAQQALVSFGVASQSMVTIAMGAAKSLSDSFGISGDFLIKIFSKDIPQGTVVPFGAMTKSMVTIAQQTAQGINLSFALMGDFLIKIFKTDIPAAFAVTNTAAKTMNTTVVSEVGTMINTKLKAHVTTLMTQWKTNVPSYFKATETASTTMKTNVNTAITGIVTQAKSSVSTLGGLFNTGGTLPKALAASGTAAGTFKTNFNSAMKALDTSSAVSEVNKLKSAIDNLQSKTVTATVKVSGSPTANMPDRSSNESSFIPGQEVTIGGKGGNLWINLAIESVIEMNEQVLGRQMNRQIIRATQNYS